MINTCNIRIIYDEFILSPICFHEIYMNDNVRSDNNEDCQLPKNTICIAGDLNCLMFTPKPVIP